MCSVATEAAAIAFSIPESDRRDAAARPVQRPGRRSAAFSIPESDRRDAAATPRRRALASRSTFSIPESDRRDAAQDWDFVRYDVMVDLSVSLSRIEGMR